MFGLSAIGVVHTLFGLIAIVIGAWILYRDKEISPGNTRGRLYLLTTLVSAASALMMYRRGVFGPGHGLAVLTLLALAGGTIAATTRLLGRSSRYLQAFSYSGTLLFSAIPGVTEALTRLPLGSPFLPSADAPQFKPIYAALVVLFFIGYGFQYRWLRKHWAS
jgi:uncharacterized membrane protein